LLQTCNDQSAKEQHRLVVYTREKSVNFAQLFVAVLEETFIEASKECYDSLIVGRCNTRNIITHAHGFRNSKVIPRISSYSWHKTELL